MKSKKLIFTGLTVVVSAILFSCATPVKSFPTSDPNKIGVKSNQLRGTIFTASYPDSKLHIDSTNLLRRFTPGVEDIALAENILKDQIKIANKRRIKQFGKRRRLNENHTRYFRQYFGLININGDRIIYINFHWDRFRFTDKLRGEWNERLDYTSDYTIVLDGGSRYWITYVNLTAKDVSK